MVFDHPTPYGWAPEKFTKSATFTNTMTLLGNTIVRVYHPCGINDGINTNFVNTEGEVDVNALRDLINNSDFGYDARTGLIGRLDRSLNSFLNRSPDYRNLVLPIYNMLQLYFIKR